MILVIGEETTYKASREYNKRSVFPIVEDFLIHIGNAEEALKKAQQQGSGKVVVICDQSEVGRNALTLIQKTRLHYICAIIPKKDRIERMRWKRKGGVNIFADINSAMASAIGQSFIQNL